MKGRGFLAHLSHSHSQRIFRKTWPSLNFQLETYFPLPFLNFEVQFPQTCTTLHKKLLTRCLPELPKAQAQEAPLQKERHLRGPRVRQLCVQSSSPLTGSSFFPSGKEHSILTKRHASGPDPVSNCEITGASLFGAPKGKGCTRPSPIAPALRVHNCVPMKPSFGRKALDSCCQHKSSDTYVSTPYAATAVPVNG